MSFVEDRRMRRLALEAEKAASAGAADGSRK
jgi:hypothetical protein